jgi:hypothetical protein
MNFDGLDLSNKDNKYDFHINVENADLHKLKTGKRFNFNFKGMSLFKWCNTIENLREIFISKHRIKMKRYLPF